MGQIPREHDTGFENIVKISIFVAVDSDTVMDTSLTLDRILSFIKSAARAVGRELTRQLLLLYYVLKEGGLTASEKTMIYLGLLYVLVPGDLIPRRVFKVLGLTDDALAIAFVIKKVYGKITPRIEQKAAMQVDKWFGYEVLEPDEQ